MKYFRVYLKVCEGCGGLWFRTQLENEVYCANCGPKLALHAKPRQEKRRGRRPGHRPVMMAAVAGGAR